MKAKLIVACSMVLAVTLILATAPYALSCSPEGDGQTSCVRLPLPPSRPQPVVSQVAAVNMPKFGTSPDSAVEPLGSWQTIAPNETHWYKMNDAGMLLQVWVDANGQARDGMAMAIYAPDQKDLYGKPVGRGSFNASMPSHDLFWTGRTNAVGVWYAEVSNRSQAPISYTLDYKRVIASVSGQCSVCHGFNIEWDRCHDNGTPFCENLQQQYDGH